MRVSPLASWMVLVRAAEAEASAAGLMQGDQADEGAEEAAEN